MRFFLLFLLPFSVLAVPAEKGLSGKEIAGARKIYVAKCAKCHAFYEPKNYSQKDWDTWMGKMTRKSKLKEEQADLLTRYLNAYRSGELPGKPQDKPGAPSKAPGKK